MNIVHVVRQFYPAVGGIESVVQELALAQVAAGHRVRVITLNRVFKRMKGDLLHAQDVIGGVEIIRIPFFGSHRYPLAPSVIKFVRDADIVHVHAIDFFFDYLAWSKPLHRKKLVVSTHGGFFHTPYAARLKWLYFFTITRISLAWYDCVAAVSVPDRKLFGKIRKRDIVCIENGVNVSKYVNASSPVPVKAILSLGRLASNKRLERLICFVAALRRRDPEWKLTIAGHPWDIDAADLIAFAEVQHIRGAVTIVVSPTDDEIRELMRRCSIIASASEYEGFGVAAVEGMSAGLFPVLSEIPAFRRLIMRGGVGMLVDFSDAEAAADKLTGMWQAIEADYTSYRRCSVAAASQYDWERVSQEYTKLYERVCGTKMRNILGVPILVSTAAQVMELLDARFECDIPTKVAFANTNLLNIASESARYRAVLQKFLVINDGIGVDIASHVLFGSRFPENLNGTDFTPDYLRNTRHRYRIFLLGGRPGIVERASEYLSVSCSRHQIVGCHHGYFPKEHTAKIIKMIRASNADIILVAMGNPQQELWLAENVEATGCRLAFGVGALFDFIAGHAHRAPTWIRAMRLEWLYRLVREPGRLWRRYLVGNPVFIFRVFGQRYFGAGANTIDITLP
jgi:alpha-1,3-mannosyltransferase